MPDADALARAAEGQSVTADRLRGAVEYYPDSLTVLDEGQRPQHLVLLTTATSGCFHRGYGGGSLRASASRGGVAVVCEASVLVVVDDDYWELPYDSLDLVGREGGDVELYANGWLYTVRTARRADEETVVDATTFLRRRVRERAVEGGRTER